MGRSGRLTEGESMRGSRHAVLTAILVFVPMIGSTQIVVTPGDLGPGEPYRLVFYLDDVNTGGSFDLRTTATSADIGFYNDHIRQSIIHFPELRAYDWTALVSTTTVDARDNTGTNPTDAGHASVPIYSLTGVRVADDNIDLWDGTIQSFIVDPDCLCEDSNSVLTGSNTDGTKDSDGYVVGNLAGLVAIGYMAERTDSGWVNNRTVLTTSLSGLPAVSEVITVGEIFDDGFESATWGAWSAAAP